LFLLDVDNTLLDNDRFAVELSERLEQSFGRAGRDRYWEVFAQRRTRLGYADYLGTLEEFRADQVAEPALSQMSDYLLDYAFAQLMYPQALEAIARLRTLGPVVVLTDGDVVFQPRKIKRSGIWDAVSGEVLICLHKEHSLEIVQHKYPANHYICVDDKPLLLAAMKLSMGERLPPCSFARVITRGRPWARRCGRRRIWCSRVSVRSSDWILPCSSPLRARPRDTNQSPGRHAGHCRAAS
jgi:hypothetical protein